MLAIIGTALRFVHYTVFCTLVCRYKRLSPPSEHILQISPARDVDSGASGAWGDLVLVHGPLPVDGTPY